MAVGAVTNRTHHGHDLLDGRRVSGVLLALVPGRTASVVARHGRRRAAVASNVQQSGFHESSLQGWLDNPLLLDRRVGHCAEESRPANSPPSVTLCPRKARLVPPSVETRAG